MARNPKVELRGHEGQVVHPITDGDCVIFSNGETLAHKLSEQEEVMYAPEVTNSSPMFKVGEGDSSDYSANVLDGAYQEAVLKGQTYVNTIQEPSADVITLPTPFTEYERTQSKTFTEMQDGTFGLNLVGQSYVNCIQEPSEPNYVALGENLEFQNKKVEYTTDGQIKSAMLNGMTLVNLTVQGVKKTGNTTNFTQENGYMKWNSTAKWQKVYYSIKGKPNTKYMVRIKNKHEQVGIYARYNTENPDGDNAVLLISNTLTGEQYKIFTSKDTGVFTVTIETQEVLTDIWIQDFMILEYQDDMENWDIPYFEGMQSVTMTTELENVCSRYNSGVAKNGKTFTVGTPVSRRLDLSGTSNILNYNFKPNTKYLMQFKISNLNLDGISSLKLIFSDDVISSGNCLFGEKSDVTITQNGIYRTILTTTNLISTSTFVIKGYVSEWENSTSTTRKLTISNVMCIEYQNGMENWDLPYFEATQLIKPLKIQSVNKNILNIPLTYKVAFQRGEKKVWSDYWGTEEYVRVQPNTTYTFSNSLDKPIYYGIVFYNRAKEVVYWQNDNIGKTFTTTSDTYYVRFALNSPQASEPLNCQLEEGSTSTDYIPHQSKTTSALEPITLRAIGDVKDTLDLSTGEYVQRIGEIVFDGSDDEGWYYTANTDDAGSERFCVRIVGRKYYSGSIIICDKYRVVSFADLWNGVEDNCIAAWGGGVDINVRNTKYTSTVDFKSSLQQNPIKIQYELANPITRKISLEYPNLQTYTDITHVQSIAMDGTLIPNIFLPSDISYRAMLKPNTSYNVIVDREVISSDNQLTVNLGGTTANITANRTVVTTPSTLSNETLTFSGKDNRLAKAMLIEGSTLIDGDLPHFDGIGDVKLGRVVENLCLSDENLIGSATVTSTLYMDRIELKVTKAGSCVETFELTKQLQNGKKYFVYCPYSINSPSAIPDSKLAFKNSYDGSTIYSKEHKNTKTDGKYVYVLEQQINPHEALTIGNHSVIPVNTTMTIRRPILCEYIDGMENWDWESIGYFTGTRNIGNEFMRISNSDKTKYNSLHILPNEQIPLTFEQGGIYYTKEDTWTNAINNTNTARIRTQLFELEPNETYRVSCGNNTYNFAVYSYDNSLLGTSDTVWLDGEYYISMTKDAHKIAIAVRKTDNSSLAPSVLHQVRLEKVTDVTLRSFGGVRDELDLTRGVYIQRIKEIVLNGSEQWKLCTSAYQPTDTNYINYDLGVDNIKTSAPILCDTIKTRDWTIGSTAINSRSISAHSTNRILRLCIEKSIAPDVETLKTYLSTNMVKVQYQLRTPIEHKINISMKNELNQTIAKPNGIFTLPLMYSETNHVDINSQIYPKVQSRDYISYPVIVNNSQLHTVFHNKLGTGNLTVNLCGTSVTSVDGTSKCTITTPSTISQYELRLSGARNKVSNVCVFSGDYMNVDVPYVQGMMNAVNPIVKNVGKNLFDGVVKNGEGWWNGKVDPVTKLRRSVNLTPVKPNTEYSYKLANGRGVNFMAHGKDGKFLKYIGWFPSDSRKFIAPSDCYYIHWFNEIDDFTDFYIEESPTPSQYEPYKENICKPDYGQITLTRNMFEQGSFNELSSEKDYYKTKTASTHSLQLKRIRLIDPIPVKPNTKYIVKFNGLEDYDIFVAYFKNNERVGFEGYWKNKEFTTPSDCNQIVFVLKRKGEAQVLVGDIDYNKLIFSKVDETIYLRSLPNGVRDELNLQTGEYIQRVGEIVLDGSSDEEWRQNTIDNTKEIYIANIAISNMSKGDDSVYGFAICHKLDYSISPVKNTFKVSGSSNQIIVRISFDLLQQISLNGLIQYLQQNPITVQYQLATPIIKHINIHNFPHSYKDGHIIIGSNDPSTNVTAQMTYQCVANRTGQIQEHTEQVEKQEHEINELETLILENIRQQQNR